MKKRILSLLLALLMLLGMFPIYSTYAAETGKEVTVWYFNSASEAMEEAEAVELYRGGEQILSADLRDDISGDVQWQIEAEQNLWVDIQGGTAEDLRVSYGMVKSLLKGNTVRMRCAVSGGKEYYSDPFSIIVTDVDNRISAGSYVMERSPAAPDPLPAPVGVPNKTEPTVTEETEPIVTEETEPTVTQETDPTVTEETVTITDDVVPLASSSTARSMLLSSAVPAAEPASDALPDENTAIYTVTIEYVYADGYKFAGQRVALPYVYESTAGQTINETVTSPNCIGYSPDIASINLSDQGKITGNISLMVKYAPAQVSYTVRHYQQNVDNDEYTWVDTTLATGYTEDNTSDSAAKTYEGFTALSHYHEEIAADSSTTIDIYYDRNYYLMSFDLDGGYGVDPIYARYGASVSVGTPYKAGWNFNGWDGAIPSAMPNENKTFTASWTAQSGIAFTVAYWLEDANTEGKYNFWGSVQLTAEAGAAVQGETYEDYTKYLDGTTLNAMDTYEKQYSYYDHADADVVVKGDGSTVVNVYYNRKEYTLKFYYAMSSGSGTNAKYYVIGGSTYYFGANADNDVDKTDEVALLDQYMYMPNLVSQRGEVDEMPGLNDKGKRRNYTTGSDSSIMNGTAYTYHYISFKAKYGADTSNLWPCDVFNSVTRSSSNSASSWKGTEAYVSAWNGEHHVWYTQNNSNQTIKGNYNELDYKLLWEYSDYGDDDTVSYLCFWENGADISWSVPELYRYNIYVQNTNGTDYELLRTYDTVDDSNVDNQTAPANNGFAYSHTRSNTIENPDPTKYSEAYEVNFYYTRDQYALTFVNGGTTVKKANVYYQADLSGYTSISSGLTYHDSQQKDYYEFAGWYTTPDAIPGTEYTLSGATMPGSALTLYAHWELISHDVHVYPTDADAEEGTNQIGQTISVTHDTLVPESSRPDESSLKNENDSDAAFIGWFYKDENGEEQAFSFATMSITQEMKVYAKWRSNVMKKVTVRYVVVDEDGNEVAEIADTETLMLRVGSTRTFAAKTDISLYEDYRSSCFPTTASHSITPTAADTEIVYVFEYKQFDAVAYKVEYKVMMADGSLRPAFKNVDGKAVFVSESDYNSDPNYTEYVEEHNDNDKAVVTELYIPSHLQNATWTLPDDYVPNALKIQKVIIPEGDNTITFIYRYAPTEALYTVNHYVQNATNPTQYDLYSFAEHSGTIGETVSAAPISIPGHTYSKDVTQTNMASGNTLTDGEMSGTVNTNDTLELNFYYTVNPYPYQIMYLEKETNRVLLEVKTVDANNALLTGLYGAKVSYTLGTDGENALLTDYDVDAMTKSIYIQMEAGDTANVNTIVFYYTRKSADLIISKTVELDAEQAAEEGIHTIPEEALKQEFVFTIYCPTGFHKSVYDYTLTEGEDKTSGTVIAGTTSMTLRLKSGQNVAIHDLAMGEYTVTETYVPGFRTSVDGTIQQSYKVVMEKADVDATAVFVNTYPFYTGDLVVKKNIVKIDESDPDANGPYKVRVTLTPVAAAREVDRTITWTDSDGTAKTFIVPAITGSEDQITFTFEVSVPTDGEVKLEGVPVGSFKVEELTNNDTGYITDYYKVTYNKALHKNDEVKGTYDPANGITGEIHGGHPTAVAFTNTYKKGSLTIHKTVTQEYEKDSWQSDTFTFQITGTTELPDGTYKVDGATVTVSGSIVTVKDANGNDPTISITRTDDATSWTGSLTFNNLPAGYYTVTETAGLGNDKYTAVCPEGSLFVNDTGTATEASFINTYKRTTGNLQVGKEIKIVTPGSVIDTAQEFTFVVEPEDSSLIGAYTCEIKNENDGTVVAGSAASLTAVDGKLTFTLKHKQYILIKGLPVGNYLVKELAVEGYDSSFGDVSESAGNYSVASATITTDNTTILNCQNAYPVYYANLIVKKTVITPADHSTVDHAPVDDVFTFTVTISDYSSMVDLTNGITAEFYNSNDTQVKTDAIKLDSSGKLTFCLKADEWVNLNLPVCRYIIEETGLSSTVNSDELEDHYTTAYTVGGQNGVPGSSYTLVSGEKETVEFTNTYKRHYVDLTITTTCADNDQSFLFAVSATGTALGDIHLKVVLVGNDSQTIKDLPVGDYTITEQTEWSWRETDVSRQTVELRTQSVTVPFDFGVIDRIYWLSGYSYRKKGGGEG